ncbi:MAG: hypothetical protein Q9181_004841 [Wetmoreana brouardii]
MDQNLVALYGRSGVPPQEAYDKIDVLLKARYRAWYLAQADLPQWGETIDRQVQKYIRAMQDVVTANMYWSFHTTRYFGKQTDFVRRTRVIDVPSEQLVKNGLTLPRKKAVHPPNDGGKESGQNSDPPLPKSNIVKTDDLISDGKTAIAATKVSVASSSVMVKPRTIGPGHLLQWLSSWIKG